MSELRKFIPEEIKHISEESSKKIDKDYNEKYLKLFFGEDYEYLSGSKEFRNTQKEKIKSGDGNIKLDYEKTISLDFDKYEKGLLEFKKSLRTPKKETEYIEDKISTQDINVEKDVVLKNTYRWKVNEALATLRMLKCTKDGYELKQKLDETNSDNIEQIKELETEIDQLDRKFSRYSEFIYGKVDKNVFDYFRLGIIDKNKEILKDNEYPDEIKDTAKSLNKDLSKDIDKVNHELINNTVIKIDKETGEKEELATINPDEFKQLFDIALEEINAENEWKTVIDDNRTGLSVSQKEKKVKIPGKNRTESIKKIKALIMHEAGTHIQRRKNGERSKLILLGIGLDRYVHGEEAAATYQEQKIMGFEEYAGLAGYLAIGLTKGIDSAKSESKKGAVEYRNFYELFKILEKYFTISEYNKFKDVHKAKSSAITKSFNRCVRTFRGLNDLTSKKGYAYSKDLAYAHNINLVRLIKKDGFDESKLFLGKFDPVNERHMYLIDVLGINDEELNKIE